MSKNNKTVKAVQALKYILLLCCASAIRMSLGDDEFLSTPYIIKSVAILLLVALGIVMLVKDIKREKR